MHGFSLEIDAIDSEYTLGDLEARKREIRERLQADGVFAANKQLPMPWDFTSVLVVAPVGGAGLGDFQVEASRLEKFGICKFAYVFSRFQGEGAAREICNALQTALHDSLNCSKPDAVVIIRGGGAVNDLAWLNDFDLARLVCDLGIPVFTGIGHERDSTIIDEVAHTKFDTPSKVIAGIEQSIVQRTTEAKANFAQITGSASKAVLSARSASNVLNLSIRGDAMRHVAESKRISAELLSGIRSNAKDVIWTASQQSRDALLTVKTKALTQLTQAKRDVPSFMDQIMMEARHALRNGAAEVTSMFDGIMERASRNATQATLATDEAFHDVGTLAMQSVKDASSRTQALMLEIAGQGPVKSLNRGFSLVRDQNGKPVTRAAQKTEGAALEIQFSDGRLSAIAGTQIMEKT